MLIYTCITDDYVDLHTDLPEGPTYVVFGIENPPAPWTGGRIEDLGDPVRSSRKPKILCPFDQPNVYIDASKLYLINDEFLKLSEEILSQDKFFIMGHPHQHSYLEECAEYVSRGWVDPDTLLKFTTEVAETQFDFEEYFSPLCTILWRSGKTEEFNNLWWKWYNKGGIRDQLACSIALNSIEYDTKSSRDIINRFSDASPEGEWWNNRSGDYVYHDEEVNVIEFVDLLTEVTGLYDWKEYFRSGTDRITGESFYGDAGIYSYAIEWDDPEKEQIIVYTSITNWYDTIPDDMYYDPDVKYVCFTDGKVEKKGPWDFRPIPEHVYDEVDGDPRRLSSYAKICPHKLFPVGSKTVWLDGCYVHTKEWIEKCKYNLNEQGNCVHMLHPHRFTFHNEIMEGFGANFNSREQMLELVEALGKVDYDFTQYYSPVLTCIWRLISDEMFEFHDVWWKYSKIGSNRDQISFDCARQLTGLEWTRIHDWETISLDLTSPVSKVARNKRHPQAGTFTEENTYSDIVKACHDLLEEIRPITKIQDAHQIWQLESNEVRDPETTAWLPKGDWWYDPTMIKTANSKYSILDKIPQVLQARDEKGRLRTTAQPKQFTFWVKRLKKSLGILNLPNEMYVMHVWHWGASYRNYIRKNVLYPRLPKT